MAKKKTKRPVGRPTGKKTAQAEEVVTIASTCPRCGSANRSPYRNKIERQIEGTYRGRAYTRVTWRRCTCLDCKQVRVDKEYA